MPGVAPEVWPQATDPGMLLREALGTTRERLSAEAGEFAQPEAELVVETITGLSRTQLYTSPDRTLSPRQMMLLDRIVARRLTGEPLAHILGKAFFYSREFLVGPAVLIPRPDTETLVEMVLQCEGDRPALFADLGTGSGIIATVLTEQRPRWRCIGVDVSTAALAVARRNVSNSVRLVAADLFSAFTKAPRFDFLVSNPPYISETEMRTLDRSVALFEPRIALSGGADGLEFYRRIAHDAGSFLKAGGQVYCEIGYNQGDDVMSIFRQHGWPDVELRRDLGNRPRVVRAAHCCGTAAFQV